MTTPATPPRGRLAPSPTGALHLGNARSFLLTWLSVRSRGGTLLLRMEDLDHPKIKPGAAGQVLEDLHWLGLDWDEGPRLGGPHAPYTQSQRTPCYRQALHRLLELGLAYPCTCSRRDVESAQSAPHAGEDGLRYPGNCRDRYRHYAAAQADLPPGRIPAWRFRTPPGSISFTDAFRGPQTQSPAEEVGDFVLARHPDGAGYMLGVVVDDAAMGVTEVMRGDDLLPATGRQILLYDALGLTCPTFAHLPLLVGPDGRRLAKRHGDTRIAALREAGIPAGRIVGLLAAWSGLAPIGATCTPADLLQAFDLARVPDAPIVVTPETIHSLATA